MRNCFAFLCASLIALIYTHRLATGRTISCVILRELRDQDPIGREHIDTEGKNILIIGFMRKLCICTRICNIEASSTVIYVVMKDRT